MLRFLLNLRDWTIKFTRILAWSALASRLRQIDSKREIFRPLWTQSERNHQEATQSVYQNSRNEKDMNHPEDVWTETGRGQTRIVFRGSGDGIWVDELLKACDYSGCYLSLLLPSALQRKMIVFSRKELDRKPLMWITSSPAFAFQRGTKISIASAARICC